jgi:isoquinoline 1-oxidoreductase beta subunit
MITLTVNGEEYPLSIDPETPLLWALRDALGLKGAKYGCGVGLCGMCTVLIDGEPNHACMVPLARVAGRPVTTIEGLAEDHRVKQSWIAEQVPQCGYCQPGQIMAAVALLAQHPQPTPEQIDAAMSGVLCRCGTYPRIRRAIARAAQGSANVGRSQFPASRDTGTPRYGARDTTPGIEEAGQRKEQLPRTSEATAAVSGVAKPAVHSTGPVMIPFAQTQDCVALNDWVRIAPDGQVILVVDRSEMGQGATTALAILIAEELEVELDEVRVTFAPADPVYDNRLWSGQFTGGSSSIRGEWEWLRQQGAAAREQLLAAAAKQFGVPQAECRAERGAVLHAASGQRAAYGALASAAARQRAPKHPALKPPEQFRLVGRPLPRIEIPDMVAGRALYALDVSLPNMLTATVLRCPTFGGRMARFEGAAARAVPGVRDVIAIDSGIAVVADSFWAALRGRERLQVEWIEGPHHALDNAAAYAALAAGLSRKGKVARNDGDALRALKKADQVFEARYTTPYLAHAPLEPMTCVAHVRADACDVWVGTQSQSATQKEAARIAGLPRSKVKVHTLYLGGGFGRRLETDFVSDAVELSRRLGVPVQVVWTRGDDLQHDWYRPAHAAHLSAALDEAGSPRALALRIAGPELALEGIDVPYAIANVREEHVEVESPVPVGAWRSVGASNNAFAVECFIDELAHVAGRDPLAFRLALLPRAARHRAVLEHVAAAAGWQAPLAPGHGRGIADCMDAGGRATHGAVAEARAARHGRRGRGLAVYQCFGSVAAQVAEVTVGSDNRIRVSRVVCTIDCGRVVNPDTVRAQIEGSIALGLSAALKEEVRIAHGRVQQATFADYPILTLAEMPEVEVHVLPSEAPPGGVGEPGVPVIAPAVANAVYAATGRRLRALPLRP